MNGILARASGGGKITTKTVSLGLMEWRTVKDEKYFKQTVTVDGILADQSKQIITIVPATECAKNYSDDGVFVISQANNSLTFASEILPPDILSVHIMIEEV